MARYDFYGFRRENGRVGIRNHVIILPLDDLSNAACEAVANNIKGTLALPHPYGRLQFGEDLELHFRTLIGTGSNPNVGACVVIGIEPGWTNRVVEGIAKTGKPVAGFSIEGNGDIGTIAAASRKAQEFVQWASEKQREFCKIQELFVSTKCGESDTTSGLASCPTVGNLIDKLDPLGATTCFGETSELTGAEMVCASRAASKEVADEFMRVFSAYQEIIQRHKTSDLSESQPAKNRPKDEIHRRTRAGGGAGKRRRTLLYGYFVGSSRVRDVASRGWFRGSPLPHRPGQRDWQSHRTCDQAHSQSQDRAHHVRAHRSRRFRNSAARDDTRSGGRSSD
jgi:altronate dehydratase